MGAVEIKTLSKIVKTYRMKNNLTREQLAKRSNGELSVSTIRDIEVGINSSGKTPSPTISTLQALAKAMNMSYKKLSIEMGLIEDTPDFDVGPFDSREFLNDMNQLLFNYGSDLYYPVEQMTDIQINDAAKTVFYLIELGIIKIMR